jgi:hypothetical protein
MTLKEWLRKSFINNLNDKQNTIEKFRYNPTQASITKNVTYNHDGIIMLYAINDNGSHFVLGNHDPNNLDNFTAKSQNGFVRKKEKNFKFWSLRFDDIIYKSTGEHGKGCRLNIFASTLKQTNDWRSAIDKGFIGDKRNLKNQEVTIILKANNKLGPKSGCSINMRGGGHHKDKPDLAACIALVVSALNSGHTARWSSELSHPNYEYYKLKPFFQFSVEDGKCFGMKTTSWNNVDNTTTNRCYICFTDCINC